MRAIQQDALLDMLFLLLHGEIRYLFSGATCSCFILICAVYCTEGGAAIQYILFLGPCMQWIGSHGPRKLDESCKAVRADFHSGKLGLDRTG